MVLRARAAAPQWINEENPDQSAKCLEYPPKKNADGVIEDKFFDEPLDAAAICNGDKDGKICPLRDECLQWSFLNAEQFGVWGGMLEHDRRNMRIAYRDNDEMELLWHPPTPLDPDLEADEVLWLDLEDDESIPN